MIAPGLTESSRGVLASFMPRHPESFPTWASTVGDMIDHGTEVAISCSICRGWRVIDVAPIVATRGRDYSLIDRRFRPCRLKEGCRGWNQFHYRAVVFRPLWTSAAVERWTQRDELERFRARRAAAIARLAAAVGRLRALGARLVSIDPVERGELTAEDVDIILEVLDAPDAVPLSRAGAGRSSAQGAGTA